jgi:hypothetical protein
LPAQAIQAIKIAETLDYQAQLRFLRIFSGSDGVFLVAVEIHAAL